MDITINNLADSEVELLGEVNAERFTRFRPAALKQLNNETKLDGFRTGHIPEKVLVEKLGEERILLVMAELALQEVYPEILRANKIDAIGRPAIALTKLAAGNPLGFKIKTAVKPIFTLPDYRVIASQAGTEPTEKRRLKIAESIIAATSIALPEILVEVEVDKMIEETKVQISQTGLKFEDYLRHIKKEITDLRRDWRNEAEKRLKFGLILAEIVAREKLAPTTKAVWQFLESQV